uniref:Uncharacterized protein n=1 Tax=Schizaphis graminum TaxID=13262 RepID=A0A2S2NBT1_SCHGA
MRAHAVHSLERRRCRHLLLAVIVSAHRQHRCRVLDPLLLHVRVSHTHTRVCGALCCGPVHRQRRRPVSHPPEDDDDDDNNNNIIIIRKTTTTKCVSVVLMKYNNLTDAAFFPVSNY